MAAYHTKKRSGAPAPKGSESASQYVRAAERYMLAGKFETALEQLAIAQGIEPDNKYILAVIERANAMHRGSSHRSPSATMPPEAESGESRYLSLTVGKEFENGIKGGRPEPQLTPEEVHLRVHQFVANADALLSRGQSESAFESLMKAYLLDPLAPEVLSCEKRVLPAWESTRNQRRQQPGSAQPSGEAERVELLKRRREQERVERERALWRGASSTPGTADPRGASNGGPSTTRGREGGPGKTSSRRWKFR